MPREFPPAWGASANYSDATVSGAIKGSHSRETLLDDAVRIAERAKKAGVPVELDLWEGQIHVWQIFASRLDEGEQAIQKKVE